MDHIAVSQKINFYDVLHTCKEKFNRILSQGVNLEQTFETNTSITDTTDFNYSEYLSPDNSISELYSTASTTSDSKYTFIL